MDLQVLHDCELIEELEEKGSTIEFKTYLYSLKTLQMEPVVISCPISGNYILTELAKIVAGQIDPKDEKNILEQLFISLNDNIKVKKMMREKPYQSIGLGATIDRAIRHYLQESELPKDPENKERIKFDFLRICSQEFDQIFEATNKKE